MTEEELKAIEADRLADEQFDALADEPNPGRGIRRLWTEARRARAAEVALVAEVRRLREPEVWAVYEAPADSLSAVPKVIGVARSKEAAEAYAAWRRGDYMLYVSVGRLPLLVPPK